MYMLRKGARLMRRFSNRWIVFAIVFGLAFGVTMYTQASEEIYAVDDVLEKPVVVYGANLSDDQKEEVRRLLEVETDQVTEMEVTGADIAHYIDGNPNFNMVSSVKITTKDSGYGIVVHIITADNIKQVTSEMYSNALLTAGIENALIEVASPVQVTGHSALTGIYKAYDESGVKLDAERMEVANDELSLST